MKMQILNISDKLMNKTDNTMNETDRERLRERYLETARRLSGLPGDERLEKIACALADAYVDGMHDEFLAKLKGAAPAVREGGAL